MTAAKEMSAFPSTQLALHSASVASRVVPNNGYRVSERLRAGARDPAWDEPEQHAARVAERPLPQPLQ